MQPLKYMNMSCELRTLGGYCEPLPLRQVHVVRISQCSLMVYDLCVKWWRFLWNIYQLRCCVKRWFVPSGHLLIMHVGFRNILTGLIIFEQLPRRRGWLYCWLSGLGIGFPSSRAGGWTVFDVNAIYIFILFFLLFPSLYFPYGLWFSIFLCFSTFQYVSLLCSMSYMLLCQLKISYKISFIFSQSVPIFLSVSWCFLVFPSFLYFPLVS